MPAISAFDMLKIGVGPSSSHTLGPWRAVERWIREHSPRYSDRGIDGIEVDLFGSLALTGKGHATDKAIALALLGADPQSVDTRQIPALLEALRLRGSVELFGRAVAFDVDKHIQFHREARLPGHANGMVIRASSQGKWEAATYYSIGGGFVIAEGEQEGSGSSRPPRRPLPYPCETGAQM
ncbi:MAG: serine dehydratase beta chain, partial [Alkalispirochaetaceae bacterium]